MAERSFDDFDKYAGDYRSIHTSNVKWSGADSYYFAEHKVQLMGGYETNQRCRVLDFGCGDGATEVFIQKYFPAMMVEGIDVSEKSIQEASKKNIPRTSFTHYNGHTIPFEDACFDIVFVAAVFHHVRFEHHAQMINEIYRVLKPGGRLYFFEHNPWNPVTRYLVNTCPFDKDAKLLKASYSRKLLEKSAFREIQSKYILFFPRRGILSSLIRHEHKFGWVPFGGQYLLRGVR